MAGLNKRSATFNPFTTPKTINGGRAPLMTTGMGRKGQTVGNPEIRKGGRMAVPMGPVNPAGWLRRRGK